MKRKIYLKIFLIFILLATVQPVFAQTATVSIRLRELDGRPISQESVRIVKHPEFTEQTAVTGLDGRADFQLSRGIYEVHLSTMLDDVSALAVAEGGLEGFGITVGDDEIEYSFVFNTDERFYFDATPEQETASPIIPQLDDLHFIPGIHPTSTPRILGNVSSKSTPEMDTPFGIPEENSPQRPWPLFVVMGGMIFSYEFWTRRQKKQQAKKVKAKDEGSQA